MAETETGSRSNSHQTLGIELDQIFEEMGFGLWQILLIVILCYGAAVDTMEMTFLTYLCPCVKDQWSLSDAKESLIGSMAFVGEFLGAILFGKIADLKGRKLSLGLSLVLNCTGGFLTYFVVSYTQLVCCRFAVGMGVGGGMVALDYLVECMHPKYRGKCMMVVIFIASLGTLAVSAAAWAVLSQYGWRMLNLVCTLPRMIVLLMLFTITESPRYLLSQGKVQECKKALGYAAKLNGKELKEYKLKPYVVSCQKGHIQEIFRGSLRMRTLQLGVNWLFESFVHYSTTYMIALLLDNTNEDTGCEYHYRDILISAAAPPVFYVVAFFFVDKARKITMATALLAGSAFVLLMGADFDDIIVTLFGFGARGCMVLGVSILWIITPEFYPTEIRSSAHNFFYASAQIGSFTSSYWVYSGLDTELICGLVSAACFIMAVNSYFIEETAGLYLDDSQGATPGRPLKRKQPTLMATKERFRPDNQVNLI